MEILKSKKRNNYYYQIFRNLIIILLIIIFIHVPLFFSYDIGFSYIDLYYLIIICITILYFSKINKYYINKIIIDGENIIIGYSVYNNYKEITSLIRNCAFERTFIASRPPQKHSLVIKINDQIIKQYPSFYFDKSLWKDYVIDNVYQKLIEYQEKIKE
jgi:hypothetical protein